MNKDGKIFGKINIIDLLIVILIAAFLVGMIIRVVGSKTGEITDTVEFQYVVKVDDIRDYTLTALEKQGEVYHHKDNVAIGEITGVSNEVYKAEGIKTNGKKVFAEKVGRKTAYVTVKTKGTVVDNIYYDANKSEIGVGRGQNICTKNVSTSGTVISVSPVRTTVGQ